MKIGTIKIIIMTVLKTIMIIAFMIITTTMMTVLLLMMMMRMILMVMRGGGNAPGEVRPINLQLPVPDERWQPEFDVRFLSLNDQELFTPNFLTSSLSLYFIFFFSLSLFLSFFLFLCFFSLPLACPDLRCLSNTLRQWLSPFPLGLTLPCCW